MRRTTVLLPDDLAALVDQERRRRDVSTAEIIREALQQYLTSGQDETKFAFFGVGRSTQGRRRPAASERVDEVLADEWTYDRIVHGRDR